MIPPPEDVLRTVITAVAVVFMLSVVFAIAVLIVHSRRDRSEQRLQALHETWAPIVLEALASDGAALADDLVLDPSDRLHFVTYLVTYARRLRGTEREVLEQMAAPFLPDVARRAGHRSPELRALAVQTLTTIGMPAYAEMVVRALDDPSPLVAMTAARGLAHPSHSRFAPAVLERIDRFGQWNERFLAAMLSGLGEAAAPTLRRILSDGRASALSRSVAARALAQLHDLEAADIAAGLLAHEQDRELLGASLSLLGIVGHAGHLPVLRTMLQSPVSWVRAQAVETLARLGSPEDAVLLRAALHDPSPWVALRAAYGLQELGATSELQLLAEEDSPIGRLSREVLSGKSA